MTIDLFKSFDELDEAHGERIGAPEDPVGDPLRSLENHLVAAGCRHGRSARVESAPPSSRDSK
jgi:hypothetical protein